MTTRKTSDRTGRRAELIAALYLQLKGYRVLERRFKTKAGEIDLIARKGSLLVIIEVKARKTLQLAHESISPQSKNRIAKAADIYVRKNSHVQNLGLRYDAVFIIGGWRVVHAKDYWS